MLIILWVGVLVLFAALIYMCLAVFPCRKKIDGKNVLCDYAHRGLFGKDVPENSLKAFENAVLSYYGIELDVQLTLDGQVVVFHDYDLKRMTGVDKKVGECTLDYIKSLSLADTDLKIPTLSEVLDSVNGRVPLLIELKGESINLTLCKYVAEIMKGYKGDYIFESFNPFLVRRIKKLMPNVYAGLLYTDVVRDKGKGGGLNYILTLMLTNIVAFPDFIAYNKYDREKLVLKLIKAVRKTAFFCFTVKGEEEMDKVRSLSENSIFEINI